LCFQGPILKGTESLIEHLLGAGIGPGKDYISRDPDSAKSCNSQKNSKLLYGMGEWEMEDCVDLLMIQGVTLSL
jgi:hypothetical protein